MLCILIALMLLYICICCIDGVQKNYMMVLGRGEGNIELFEKRESEIVHLNIVSPGEVRRIIMNFFLYP